MVRKLALAMAFMVMTFYKGAFALGLGEIELQSALNQPLSAEIGLLSARPGELDQAKVQLASREAFARAGLERLDILSDLKFEITTRSNGETYLRVSSSKPVTEPFLSFLVELAWPRGRLMREYTLLLDPPVFVPEAPAPQETPVAAPQPQPESRPVTAPEPVEARPVAATGGASPDEYGPTRRDETLWEIAKRLRPDTSITMNQMMQALLRANPEAFFRGNINNLKAGYVLRIPDREEILSMSPAEALAETRRHTRLWREYRNRMAEMPLAARPAAGGDDEESEPDQASAAPRADAGGKLEIVAPDEGADTGSGAAGEEAAQAGDADSGDELLRKEVQMLSEAAEARSQENEELRQRIKELEKQLETLTQLVTLRNQEMANLQKKSAMQTASGGAVTNRDGEQQDEAQASSEQLVDMIDELLASPLTLLAVVLVVLVLAFLAWMILRRRRMSASLYQEGMPGAELAAGAAGGAAVASAAGEAAAGETSDNEPKGAEILDSEATEDSVSSFSDFPLSGMGDIHSEVSEVDPLSEADVYIAYGRYQQAEELLKETLASEPGRPELRAKLLEVYHAAKDASAFEAEAAKLAEELTDRNAPMWLKVAEMGRELNPDNPLFREGGEAPAEGQAESGDSGGETASTLDELDDLATDLGDLDLGGLDLGGEGGIGEAPGEGLDLDLDNLGQDLADDSGAKEAGEETAELAEGLDLDLDLGEFDLGAGDDQAVTSGPDDAAPVDGAGEEVFDLGEAAEAADLDLGSFDAGEAGAGGAEDSGGLDLGETDLGEFDLGADLDQAVEEAMPSSGEEDTGGGEALLGDLDEVGTKLDLARAYIDMGDNEGARSILQEVMEEGNEQHKQEAQALIDQMG